MEGTTGAPALIRGTTERVTNTLYTRPNAAASWTSSPLSKNEYTYNNLGQRITNAVTTGTLATRTETYTYDELSRLKGANYGDGQVQGYSFDAMGNRTGKTDNVTGNETYAFDNANRIATRQVGTSPIVSYNSDANGNTLTDSGRTNTWDSQNRLISCSKSGKTSEFTYGADGLRRKMQTIDSSGLSEDLLPPTHYGYDGSNVVREWTENIAGVQEISATYLLGPSGPMYKRGALEGDVRWYVYDGLGSVVGEVDVNGLLTATKQTDVYGVTRAGGTTGTPKSRHSWQGGVGHYSDDETGLVYMRARYYDPAIGRFISEDSARDGINWFIYCGNDPINRTDVTGDYWIAIILALIFVLGLIKLAIDLGKTFDKGRRNKYKLQEVCGEDDAACAAAQREKATNRGSQRAWRGFVYRSVHLRPGR